MPSEIAVPFRLDGNGRVVATTDPDDQVRQHVLALLNTTPEERAMVPGYGTNLVGLVFSDPDGDAVAQQASTVVREAMSRHEPGVDLVKVAANFALSGENIAQLDVDYRRRDAADSSTVGNTNSAIIGASGSVREFVRG